MRGGKISSEDLSELVKQTYSKTPKKQIGDFVLDEELTTDEQKIYHNPKTGKAWISHRGTEGTVKDWSNNLQYALGNYESTDRYKRGKAVQEKTESKYGKKNISTVGHSQGAVLSRKLGKDTNEIINVNPASLGEAESKNTTTVRSKKDVVSIAKPVAKAVESAKKTVNKYLPKSMRFKEKEQGKTIEIQPASNNPLTEHSADILERTPGLEIGQGRGKAGTVTVKELREQAKQLGLKKYSALKKEDLIKLIADALPKRVKLKIKKEIVDALPKRVKLKIKKEIVDPKIAYHLFLQYFKEKLEEGYKLYERIKTIDNMDEAQEKLRKLSDGAPLVWDDRESRAEYLKEFSINNSVLTPSQINEMLDEPVLNESFGVMHAIADYIQRPKPKRVKLRIKKEVEAPAPPAPAPPQPKKKIPKFKPVIQKKRKLKPKKETIVYDDD